MVVVDTENDSDGQLGARAVSATGRATPSLRVSLSLSLSSASRWTVVEAEVGMNGGVR